jgi:hypothetical protein
VTSSFNSFLGEEAELVWKLPDSVLQVAQVPVLPLLVVPLDSAQLSLGAGLSACRAAVVRLVAVLELVLDLEPLQIRAAAGGGRASSRLRRVWLRCDRLLGNLTGRWVLHCAHFHLTGAIVVHELLPLGECRQVVHVAVRHKIVEGTGEYALFRLKRRNSLSELAQPYLLTGLLGDALKRLRLVLGILSYDSSCN